MAQSLRKLRRKIKTTRDIGQITRAMKLVAAARLKRVQQLVAASRPYYEQLQRVLEHVAAATTEEFAHPYLIPREVGAIAVLVIGGDRGLCGAFNSNLWAAASEFIQSQTVPVQVITVGRRMERLARRQGLEVLESWPGARDPRDVSQMREVSDLVRRLYEQGKVDRVQAIYADFVSMVRHPAVSRQILPIPEADLSGAGRDEEYIFEPPVAQLLTRLLPRAIEAEICNIILNTQVAEQAARMIAMSAATDNAEKMISGLTRQLNRARQEEITAELMDVVGGAQAIGL